MSPTASVIMAVYNASQFLKEAIDSILSQSYKNYELIIVNDCCIDNSVQIIQSYNDSRIRLIHNEANIGLAASLNKGIALSKGKYIIRMDDDDLCHPGRFEKQIKYMENHPDVGICGSWVKVFGDENYIWKTARDHDQIRSKLFFNTALAHPSIIIRKSIIESFHLNYDTNFRRAQDFDLFNRAAIITKLHNIQEILLFYRIAYNNKKTTNHNNALNTLKEVRLRTYRQLQLKESEDFLAIHQKLAEGSYKGVPLKSTINWIKSVYQKNEQHQIIPNTAFKIELADKWFKTVIYNLPRSLLFLPPYPTVLIHLTKSLISKIKV